MHVLYQRLITTISEGTVGSTEYYIASLMIQNINRLHRISISEIASLCNVSKSTISKFVRQIGFDDYTDFRLEAVRQKKKDVYILGGDTINITDYMYENGEAAYLSVLFCDIRTLFQGREREKIAELADDIYSYKKIAAFGEVYSQTASMNFQYKMSYYRRFIYTTLNDRKQESYIAGADENTLLIIFSNSGRYISMFSNREGEPEKDCFNKTRAKVTLITSNATMATDVRVDNCIVLNYSTKVQEHPILYQLLIEQIALVYQRKYGFPEDDFI